MNGTARRGGPELDGREARDTNADAVQHDRQRHGGGGDRHPQPPAWLEEIADERRDADEGHQRSDAAARFVYMNGHRSETQHVTVAQDGYARSPQQLLAQARCEKLQRYRDAIEHDRRQRNHEDQEEDREREQPKVRPARYVEDRSRQDADERDAREKQLRAERADDEDEQAREDHREPEIGGTPRLVTQPIALAPSQRERDRRNHPSVRVVRIALPLPREPDQHRSVEQADRSDPDREPEHLVPAASRTPANDRDAAQAQADQYQARRLG